MVFRLFPNCKRPVGKIMHAFVHSATLAFTIVGLVAAFKSHNDQDIPIPNMYSLHSWIGLAAVILFCLQWATGFISFLAPKMSDRFRASYLPLHKFWGIAIFLMVCATALMGITEKAFFALPKY